jgi:hypothetical protein
MTIQHEVTSYLCSVPLTTLAPLRLPYCEHTSLSEHRKIGTGFALVRVKPARWARRRRWCYADAAFIFRQLTLCL